MVTTPLQVHKLPEKLEITQQIVSEGLGEPQKGELMHQTQDTRITSNK